MGNQWVHQNRRMREGLAALQAQETPATRQAAAKCFASRCTACAVLNVVAPAIDSPDPHRLQTCEHFAGLTEADGYPFIVFRSMAATLTSKENDDAS